MICSWVSRAHTHDVEKRDNIRNLPKRKKVFHNIFVHYIHSKRIQFVQPKHNHAIAFQCIHSKQNHLNHIQESNLRIVFFISFKIEFITESSSIL